MSKRAKIRFMKYGITGVITVLLAVTHVCSTDFANLNTMGKYLVLCDAFTIPGLILLMLGSLMWIAGKGGLDGISYVMRYVVSMLIPGKKHLQQSYGEYVAAHSERQVSGYGFLFITGGICMAITAVFLILFYGAYSG